MALDELFAGSLGLAVMGVMGCLFVDTCVPERTGAIERRIARLHGDIAEREHLPPESERHVLQLRAQVLELRAQILEAESDLLEAREVRTSQLALRRTLRAVVLGLVGLVAVSWILIAVLDWRKSRRQRLAATRAAEERKRAKAIAPVPPPPPRVRVTLVPNEPPAAERHGAVGVPRALGGRGSKGS